MVTIKLEDPPGHELTTRQFSPGQNLRVGCKITGPLYIPGVAQTIRFELFDTNFTPYFTNTLTDLLGDAWVDWVLPSVVTKATIRVTAVVSIGQNAVVDIPIGIGVVPDPIRPPVDQTVMWAIGIGLVLILAAGTASYGFAKGVK